MSDEGGNFSTLCGSAKQFSDLRHSPGKCANSARVVASIPFGPSENKSG